MAMSSSMIKTSPCSRGRLPRSDDRDVSGASCQPMTHAITIRRATPDDAASIGVVLQAIVGEKVYSAIDSPFTLEQEHEYLKSLSTREGVFLAETTDRQVSGFPCL